jgi:hypothetical protein
MATRLRKRKVASGALLKIVHQGMLLIAIAFLGLITGSYLTFADALPARVLTEAYRGGQALVDKWTRWNEPYPGEFWQPARTQAKGVTVYDRARAANGFTLFTSGEGQKAVLIPMTGEVLHEWRPPFSALWDKPRAVAKPQPASEAGRLLEVTPGGEIVWEHLNPAPAGESGEKTAVISAERGIDPATLDPEFLDGSRADRHDPSSPAG